MKRIKYILLPILTLTIFSCDDYLDINTDPNNLPFDKIDPSKLLPAAQVGTFAVQSTNMNQLGNVFSNAWAPNVQAFTGGYSREFQLTIDNAFYNNIWDGLYRNVNNFQQIINYPNTDGKQDNYVAVAKILKAHYLQHIVDLYGDAPYTEAFKGLANLTPKYNDDQFIYRELLSELDDARELIQAANPDAENISTFDVMLGGDMTAWEKFANNIELRMLLRMSNNTGTIAAYRDGRLTDLAASNNFLLTDVKINPGYSNNNNDQLNPFFGFAIADATGTPVNNFSFITSSGHAFKSMRMATVYTTGTVPEIIPGSGVFYPNVTDPRFTRIFRNGAGATELKAVTQGSNVVDVFPVGSSAGTPGRLGLGTLNPYNLIPEIVGTGSLLDNGAKVDGYVMTESEIHFLLAEAAIRRTDFGNAADHFNAGVDATGKFLNVTDANMTNYKTEIDAKPNFGFTASTTFNEKLHAIMYQKWIALMGVNGIESYIDYTRTGYPLTPLATTATKTSKPKRLIYPVSEYVANSANVPNISPDQIFAATDKSHPFWLLGDPALGK
jgi:hypothetical protein